MSPAAGGEAKRLDLEAPAKINLGLRLVGRRADGYHLLESLFAPIEIYDSLSLETLPGPQCVELTVEIAPDAGLPEKLCDVTAGPGNLVSRAARAFCEAAGLEATIRIHLVKRIPAGAGLGGGSSDAAAILRGLQALAPEPLGREALHALALELGADVPFFLNPAPALVTGIGQKIERIDPLPPLHLVVANSGNSLATAEVYRAADALRSALTEPSNGSTMRAILRLAGERADLEPALGELLINDLEPAARRLCPPVAMLSNRLREAGAIGVSMSGSGATVFGVFDSRAHAEDGAKRLADRLREDLDPTDREASRNECWIRVTKVIATVITTGD